MQVIRVPLIYYLLFHCGALHMNDGNEDYLNFEWNQTAQGMMNDTAYRCNMLF